MEEKFYNDDFEKFLQDQVKHHKMFPSDRTWRNIHNTIHQDYKWPALTIAAFGFLAAIIAISVYFSPGPNIFAVDVASKSKTQAIDSKANTAMLNNASSKKAFANSTSATTLADFVATSISLNRQAQEAPILTPSQDETPGLQNSNTSTAREINTLQTSDGLFVPGTGETITVQEEETNRFSADIAKQFVLPAIAPRQKLSLTGQKALVIPAIKSSRMNRWDYSVYITPSAGYRRLIEDKSTTIKQSSNVGGPVAMNYISGVNEVVRHKPGTGMEAGFNVGYKIGKKVKVKAGLQLNARQYNIEAFLSTTDVATIAFIDGKGVDSMTAYSSYRTSSGYEATQLQNQYYQVSIPISLQYEVVGNRNVQLNIAAGLQPTYMISENAYLISSDFRNYVENPEMSRKWNMNANIETFLSIKNGSYKWQLGPQFRYQLRPTSVDKYPIREYLIDYGVKIGVTKSIK